MSSESQTPAEIPGLYRIITMMPFRRTPGVFFDVLQPPNIPGIDGIDRVIHEGGAVSPGPVAGVTRPWYMHPHQDDNLLVLSGSRLVDIYTKRHGRVESFEVTPQRLSRNGTTIFDGPAMLVWPRGVFHRIRSGSGGSASLNLATRYDGFDIRTNFSIYDLDTETGEFKVVREGHLDQA